MPDPRPFNQYPCSQADLYAVCRIGWNSYAENQPAFLAFNTLYDIAYGTNALAEIDAAVNLPGFQERDEAGETFHIQLTEVHAGALFKWKSLRSYIKHAFPPELLKPKIESAGYDHYPQAANLNWAETQLLLVAGQHFLDNNAAELTAGGMPAAFAADYAAASSAFLTLYDQFTDAEQDSQEATDVKITANNAIYKKLMAMFEDAQMIFEHEPSKRERFVFSQVYSMITKPGGGTTSPTSEVKISGRVTDNFAIPLSGVEVTLYSVNSGPGPDDPVTFTNEDGSYEFSFPSIPEAAEIVIEGKLSGYSNSSRNLFVEPGQTYTGQDLTMDLNP
ncbi:MAG: carboxypeptidase regulatory-like domain-containing protein [Flavobacteriales bacterium]|nr:carboxypeptidase regulatory-like domain-containing protein [Flavobacteriales bacterium]